MNPDEEAPHAPGADPSWCESWSFDFARSGAGGYVRLTYVPAEQRASYCVYLVSPRFGLVVVRDHDVPLPRRLDVLEVRADSLWAEMVCEQPFEHWGLAAEAFGLRLDDQLDTLRDPQREERGERIAVGLDLEWEALAPPATFESAGAADRYSQAGRVHGTLLVGSAVVPFDGSGVRDHGWGPRTGAGGQRITGASASAAFELSSSSGTSGPDVGWSWSSDDPDAVRAHHEIMATTDTGADGVPRRVHWHASRGLDLDAEVVTLTVVPTGGAQPPTLRALCTLDRDPWWAWAEWSQ